MGPPRRGVPSGRHADAEDAAAKAIVKKPIAVYIRKVYEEGNFAVLGIGTS